MSVNIKYNNDRCGCHPLIKGFDPNCIQCGEILKLEEEVMCLLKNGDKLKKKQCSKFTIRSSTTMGKSHFRLVLR
jgi:hypothetical protein